MFEARLTQGALLKKMVDGIKDLVTEANLEVSSTGLQLQSMDSSHVALVQLVLRADGFEHFRCDHPRTLGLNITTLAKVLKCAGNDDVISLSARDEGDALTLRFEGAKNDRISEFEVKLMDIDSEHMGVPDAEYSATCRLPSPEFSRIVRDLATIGDGVDLAATKEGIRFTTSGDVGTGNITCRHHESEKAEESTTIEVTEPVSLSCSLKHLVSFSKADKLSSLVKISMSADLPISVEYQIEDMGFLRFFLAPKMAEDDGMGDNYEDDV